MWKTLFFVEYFSDFAFRVNVIMFDEMKIKLQGLEILKTFMRSKLDAAKYKVDLFIPRSCFIFVVPNQPQN